MRRANIGHRYLMLIGGICVVFILLLGGMALFLDVSRIIGSCEYIDIRSGRLRYQRYIMYIKTVDRVEETEFSRYARQYYGITATPEWKIVKSYAFGGNISRNHLYHGSLDAAQHLARSFGEVNFSVNAMKKVIITFLGLLDTDGGDLRACEYAASVLEIAFKAKKAGIRSVSEDELPNP